MPLFTQSDLDEVLNEMFKFEGIFELVASAEASNDGVRWHAFYRTSLVGQQGRAVGDTPAEAIRKAQIALVAQRLSS